MFYIHFRMLEFCLKKRNAHIELYKNLYKSDKIDSILSKNIIIRAKIKVVDK